MKPAPGTVGVLFTLSLLLLAVPAGAQCPTSFIGNGCSEQDWSGIESTLPAAQLFGAWAWGLPCNDGCYDIPHGALAAVGSWNPYNGGCGSNPIMRDEFTIVGVPDGTPVGFTAHLFVQGTIESKGRIWARIADGPGGLDTQESGPVTADVSYHLDRVAGVPFLLDCELGTMGLGEPGSTSATATLRFSGLPSGAAIVSCQKYDLPVSAQTRTWGRVKGVYR